MGFDIRMEREPSSYPPDYEPQYAGEPAYYRIVEGSQWIILGIMIAAGVVDTEKEPPEIPEWPPLSMSDERFEQIEPYMDDPIALRGVLTPEEWQLYESYQRELGEATEVNSVWPGLVPAFKFKSSDGWLVSPAECRSIADGLDKLLRVGHPPLFQWLEKEKGCSATVAQELIRSWGGYNRVASECDGYRVR